MMRFIITIFFATIWLVSCSSSKNGLPHIVIKTAAGDIECELYADKAPLTVTAFLANVRAGNFKNCSFYRILNDENQPSNALKASFIQGGLWKNNYKKASGLPKIPHEPTDKTGLLHKDGTLSMARLEPGTARSEFFICIGDQPGFDFGGENNPDKQGYAAFGKVVKGRDIVEFIYKRPETDQAFDPPVIISNIVEL
jgi:peptidyl-prolyl cis-trans isomerase A (cyclophilin A)